MIIEFDGDYWHSKQVANPTREQKRDNGIKSLGYEVLHVKEKDYKDNPQKVVDKCLTFLKQ